MWKASYGKEPFDLRLTALRLIRNLNKILALTVLGTLLFGGGYYVKNVLFGAAPTYAATSTYKVQYVEEPTKSGDYYINTATWDSLVHTQEFLNAVQEHLTELAAGDTVEEAAVRELSAEELSAMISATLPSDFHIPTTTVVADEPTKSTLVAAAVEQTMEKEFVTMMNREVLSVKVLDPGNVAEEILDDVRPARAFALSAILSFFFVTTVFLLKETGDDSIWLPSTLRRRYGLPVLGTIESRELAENVKYLFRDKQKIGVCSVSEEVNPQDVIAKFREKSVLSDAVMTNTRWISVPTPLLSPEACGALREMDGILLAVKAGAHAGKQLEYVLELLEQQDCKITAVILWNADETLIRAYYGFRREPETE